MKPGIRLDDPCASLPAQNILWFQLGCITAQINSTCSVNGGLLVKDTHNDDLQ